MEQKPQLKCKKILQCTIYGVELWLLKTRVPKIRAVEIGHKKCLPLENCSHINHGTGETLLTDIQETNNSRVYEHCLD